MDAVDRMFQVLVNALRKSNPAAVSSPFTVSDLYQQIIPYRHFRRELALESNQEYELTLMKLLGGERGYLDVDERLGDGLKKELASGSPEPARVRDFADAQVSVNPAALASVPSKPTPAVAAPPAPAGTPAQASGGASTATPASSPVHGCRYCGGELPTGRVLNYCPHCGQNLQVHHCPACGAELEAGWRFCVACGKTVS
jgi:hypothetical protein